MGVIAGVRDLAGIAELAERHAESADWVEITEGYHIPTWQYRDVEEGEAAGVMINLSPTGEVKIVEGLVKRDVDTQVTDTGGAIVPVTKTHPLYSTPLCRYLAHHKSLAVQSILLSNRRKAREVAAVLLLGGSDSYRSPLRLQQHDGLQSFSITDEPPANYLELERHVKGVAARIKLEDDPAGTPAWAGILSTSKPAPDLYEAVKALDDEELDALLILLPVLCFGQGDCGILDTEDSLFNRVACDLEVDMRKHWRPDEDFLRRRTREQLLQIALESGLAPHRKTKKGELVKEMARHFERARTAETPNKVQAKARDWLPEAMQFPAIDPPTDGTE